MATPIRQAARAVTALDALTGLADCHQVLDQLAA